MSKSKEKFLEQKMEEFSQHNAEEIFLYLQGLKREEEDYWAQKEYEEWLNKEKENESERTNSIRK